MLGREGNGGREGGWRRGREVAAGKRNRCDLSSKGMSGEGDGTGEGGGWAWTGMVRGYGLWEGGVVEGMPGPGREW